MMNVLLIKTKLTRVHIHSIRNLHSMIFVRDAYAGGGRGVAAPPALSKDVIILV